MAKRTVIVVPAGAWLLAATVLCALAEVEMAAEDDAGATALFDAALLPEATDAADVAAR